MGFIHKKLNKFVSFGLGGLLVAALFGCPGGGLAPGGGGLAPGGGNFFGGPVGGAAAPDGDGGGDGKGEEGSGGTGGGSTGPGDGIDKMGLGGGYGHSPLEGGVVGPIYDHPGYFKYQMIGCAEVEEYFMATGMLRVRLEGMVECLKDGNTGDFDPCPVGWVMRIYYNSATKFTQGENTQSYDVSLEAGGKFETTLLVSTEPHWRFVWRPSNYEQFDSAENASGGISLSNTSNSSDSSIKAVKSGVLWQISFIPKEEFIMWDFFTAEDGEHVGGLHTCPLPQEMHLQKAIKGLF